jgi:hypothetical protein
MQEKKLVYAYLIYEPIKILVIIGKQPFSTEERTPDFGTLQVDFK